MASTVQITVRARDCQVRAKPRPFFIGDLLTYHGQDWIIVGLFMGVDQANGEGVEEYLVLEGRQAENAMNVNEGRDAHE